MNFDRRDFIKTTGIALGTTALSASATAESTWNYELVGEALDAGVHEAVVQGDWAYAANGTEITTVDVSDPSAPVLGGTALGHGSDNIDVKVEGDMAGLANDGDPGDDTNPAGVTFFDVSDPAAPVEISFYDDVDSGIHNHFIDGDYAYICINESGEAFASEARMEVVDVSDPSSPHKVGEWRLADHHPDMAATGINPIHDVYVQDDLAYQCYWDAGVVVVDVSDPTDPTTVAHFGAADDAAETPSDDVEAQKRYLGGEKTNAHYAQPTPSGDYTLVGAETFPGPFEDTVVPGDHGGIRIFDTSDVSTDSTPSDPYEDHVGYIPAPDKPTDALRTSHNFDVREDKVFASFYQGGMRAYGIEDPTAPEELAAFAPLGTAYWTNVDLPESGPTTYNLGSDIGKGLTILELNHETPGEQNWETDEDLGPYDVLEPTMQKPL
jgi:hypothetical protein